jgi:chaperone required for assembly of F1-ATPase
MGAVSAAAGAPLEKGGCRREWRGCTMKRFYKDVSVAEGPEGWRVLLDGRAIKTVGGRPQALPGQALALAMAREWAEQGEDRPGAVCAARHGRLRAGCGGARPAEAVAALLPYAETDTVLPRRSRRAAVRASRRCGNPCWRAWKRATACGLNG